MEERHLVLDTRVIARTDNARLSVTPATRSAANPLFGEDRPWEMRFDNLYPNVLWDAEEELYKCWYSPFCIDYRSHGMSLEERQSTRYNSPPGREMALCYATSRDGIAWEKPELGLVDYRGSRANNIVLRGPHGAGVLKDARAPDPARRYKMFASLGEQELAVAFSADGIRWGRFLPCPTVNPYQVDGTHYHALWVEERGEYAGFTRLRDPRSAGAAAVGSIRGAWPPRQVGRTASPDFLHWSPAAAVLEGTDENLQIYSMPVFRHANLYLGLPAIHNQRTDQVWTELAWSPDTVTWHRVCPGSPLIANAGLVGSYDWGCAYAAAHPVIVPGESGEMRLYYGASNFQHTSWRDGSLCLATLRPDGFACYEQVAGDRPTTVVTAPLAWSGAGLRITADLAPIGALGVAVLDHGADRVTLGGTTAISPPEMEAAGMDRWDNQVGTGPFMFGAYEINSHMTYERNPNYWDQTTIDGEQYQLPFVDKVIVPIIADEASMVAALRTGKADMASSVFAVHWKTLDETAPELNSHRFPISFGSTAYLKTTEPPFDNRDVRRAMMVGTDLTGFQKLRQAGDLELPTHWFPVDPIMPSYTAMDELPEETRMLYDYNPEKAKQMLADAGYPNGFTINYTTLGWPEFMTDGALLKDQWEKIGVTVDLQGFEAAVWSAQARERTYTGSIRQGHCGGCPMTALPRFTTGHANNYTDWSDPHFDAIVEQLVKELDPGKRTELIKEASIYLLNEAIAVPQAVKVQGRFWWPWINNYYGETYIASTNTWLEPSAWVWIDQNLKQEMGY